MQTTQEKVVLCEFEIIKNEFEVCTNTFLRWHDREWQIYQRDFENIVSSSRKFAEILCRVQYWYNKSRSISKIFIECKHVGEFGVDCSQHCPNAKTNNSIFENYKNLVKENHTPGFYEFRCSVCGQDIIQSSKPYFPLPLWNPHCKPICEKCRVEEIRTITKYNCKCPQCGNFTFHYYKMLDGTFVTSCLYCKGVEDGYREIKRIKRRIQE